jgi:hypothetical protein
MLILQEVSEATEAARQRQARERDNKNDMHMKGVVRRLLSTKVSRGFAARRTWLTAVFREPPPKPENHNNNNDELNST